MGNAKLPSLHEVSERNLPQQLKHNESVPDIKRKTTEKQKTDRVQKQDKEPDELDVLVADYFTKLSN